MVAQADLPFENVCVTGELPANLKQLGPAETWFLLLVHTGELGGFPHVRGSVISILAIRKSPIRERDRLLDWVSTPRGPPGFVRC